MISADLLIEKGAHDMPKERPGPTYRCPHCGEHILRLPDSHDFLVCNRCRARYMVMIDPQTRTVAFVDQAAGSGPPPLGLPKGSVRALVSLAMAATALVLVVRGQDLPGALASLLLAIIGFYFGFRTKASTLSDRLYDPTATRELPLYMPPGVIRLMLILSFVAAGALLASRGRLGATREQAEFFVILSGLVVGHYFSKITRPTSRGSKAVMGHIKAMAVLALTCSLAWVFISGAGASMPPWSVMGLCATVSFYFGSRS